MAKPIAYGPLALMPDTFYALTPSEFYDLIEGYRLRRQIEQQERSYFVSWIIAPHVKKAIPPDVIYKPLAPRREISEAELAKDRAYFMAMDRRQRGGETD